MAKSFFRFFQFGAKFLFLQGAANDHGQLGNLMALEILEGAVGGEFGEELRAGARSQEDQSALLGGLQKELQGVGALDAGAGVLDDDDVVGGRTAMAGTMGEAGDGIVGDDKLPFFERMEAGIHRGAIAMNEKDVEGTAAVRRRSDCWAHAGEVSLVAVVSGE